MTYRYHRIDGWRGYRIPATAIVGASDTGHWSDSPCPSSEALEEIKRFRREVLRPAGIHSRTRFGATSNVFCGKRWVVVAREDFDKAAKLAAAWRRSPAYNEYSLLHDADLDQLGY